MKGDERLAMVGAAAVLVDWYKVQHKYNILHNFILILLVHLYSTQKPRVWALFGQDPERGWVE